jgi:hypothetical protein
MKKKLAHSAVAVSMLALIVAFMSSPVHAQTINWRPDKAAYVPGDVGTVTITVINPSPSPLEVRNITVYYPWAGFDTNGKWLSSGNVSLSLSPFKELTSVSGGGNNWTYTTPSFNIPSWWSNAPGQQQYSCPGGGNPPRYGLTSACIILGTNANNQRYIPTDFSLTMAQPTYTPQSISIVSQWVPVASLVVLIVATAILAMVMIRLGNLPKKS